MPATPQDRRAPRKTAAKKTTAAAPRTPTKRASTRRPSPAATAPAVAAGDAAYAPTTWGSSSGAMAEDLTVPSGQKCLVRRPGAEGLLRAGVIHDLDFLTSVVDEKHIQRVKGGQPVNIDSILKDPAQLDKLVHLVDRVMCHVVVKPEVHMTPNDITSRVPGVIYADMVDLNDKLFIMNYAVGGTRDLERFRRELDESMAGLGSVAEDAV